VTARFSHSRGDADELKDVYRDNVRAVYAFFAYSVSHETAEDLTGATFERVIRSWRRFDPQQAGVRTWILAIARNLLSDHFRRQAHRHGVALDEHPALAGSLVASDDPIARMISADTVRGWLAGLGEREREVLALRFGADLAAAEIALQLGISEANVHQISSRALRRLHHHLTSSGITGSA
jgi:RNA polymerase sigma-70 factor (ECF subfamily)